GRHRGDALREGQREPQGRHAQRGAQVAGLGRGHRVRKESRGGYRAARTTLADVGGTQDAESLRVGGHDPVLDPVVNHLDEVPGAIRPTVEIPALCGATHGLPPRSASDRARTRCERGKDRIESLHHGVLAADHQAISALAAPDATAGSNIHVVNALRGVSSFFTRSTTDAAPTTLARTSSSIALGDLSNTTH